MLPVVVLSALSAAFSVNAHAVSQNTIRFQGEVNAQTCNVDVNGTSGSPIVLLPTVSTNKLSKANSSSGATNFTINVSGCQAPTSSDQTIDLVLVGNNVTTNGNLGNLGTAKNFELQLLNSPVEGRR